MDRRLPDNNESALRILDGSHLTEDAMEMYSLGRMKSEEDLEVLEEHLLVCAFCQTKLEKMDAYHQAAITAAKSTDAHPEKKKKPVGLLPVAIAAGLAAVLFIPGALVQKDPPATVDLTAVRQDSRATAPANRKLDLKLDLTGITAQPLAWELTQATGEQRFRGDLAATAPLISIEALEAGQYWVRIKPKGSAEVLREFSLSVR
jgi:hypothetical protein